MASTTEPQHVALRPPKEDPVHRGGEHRNRRWRAVLIASLVVVVGAGAVIAVVKPFSGSTGPVGGVADNADPTSVATVSLEDITSQTEVSATLGYSGSYSVVNQAQGTITWLPSLGQVISQGQVFYDIDGSPVVLLYGSTPAYRSLSEGATASAVSGLDVEELNDDLVAMGYLTRSEVGSDPSDFTSWTKTGVEKLQAAVALTQNGILAQGQVVFMPTGVRVTGFGANTVVGAATQPGSEILTGTSTGRVVTIDLDADQQGELASGDKVTITLPDGQTTPGTVTSVGTVATTPSGNGNSGSSPTITVLVTPDDPTATGNLDQAPVQVSITTGSAKDALVVPVDALLALAGGGYGLEVVSPKGAHAFEPVSLGIFDDAAGVVQVSGPGVASGQHVVIPGS
jgi:hypothetical protein